jgi:hypothetical protein
MGGMLRKLRIAFSLMSGIVCLLLIALWIRSYWWYDEARCPLSDLLIDQSRKQHAILFIDGQQRIHGSQLFLLHSLEGRVLVIAGGQNIERPGWYSSRWGVESIATNDLWPQRLVPPTWSCGFDIDGRHIRFPYWFPVALTATFCGFGFQITQNIAVLVPHWFLILAAAALAGAPWLCSASSQVRHSAS